jgi:hypothetical protein
MASLSPPIREFANPLGGMIGQPGEDRCEQACGSTSLSLQVSD